MSMKVKISKVKPNKDNPRLIKDHNYNRLVKSIEEFPEMLEKRPVVCFTDKDNKYVVLGGNMRLKASIQAGLKEIPILLADDWSEEQKKQFVIKDNVSSGLWDWDMLANEWSSEDLSSWGLEVWQDEKTDYDILDDFDIDEEVDQMSSNVRKSIMVDFSIDDYPVAFELIKFFKERKCDIGVMLIDYLKKEKEKI